MEETTLILCKAASVVSAPNLVPIFIIILDKFKKEINEVQQYAANIYIVDINVPTKLKIGIGILPNRCEIEL